jgi:two-component system, cell cycle sensor histidine kinase and response regulator CckA
MKKIDNTNNKLFNELKSLKQEYADSKARYEENITRLKKDENGMADSDKELRTNFDSTDNEITAQDKQIIRMLFDDYMTMYSSRDDLLTTYFSENFSGFTGGGDFLVKDKEKWVAITRQDFAQIKDKINIVLKDIAIQSLSDSIAVTTSIFTIHLPNIEHELSRKIARLVLIFRKESTGWKISHSSISIPYGVIYEGEVYPLKEQSDRNQFLEKLVAERTSQLSDANDKLQKANIELSKEIAEHKLTEDELRRSKKQYDSLVSKIPVGIYILRRIPEGAYILDYVSDRTASMFNVSVESLMVDYRIAFQAIHPDDRDSLISLNQEAIQKLHAFDWEGRFVIDGKDKWLHITSLPELQENGDVLWHGLVTDITGRKQAEVIIRQQYNQLKELNSYKDKLFSIIAHDLKSPFQSLLGSSEILAMESERLSQEEVLFFSRGLFDSLKNLYSLLENLLNWSMMQRDMIEYNPVNLNLKDIVNKIIELLNRSAAKKNISISNNVDAGAFVYADPFMINSVIQNLLNNAVKFTLSEGSIFVTSLEKDSFIEVSVIDTGIGIDSNRSSKLFSFSSLFTTDGTAGEKGTGLGLPLCKEFVEKNNGKIRVESELGKGSRFTFTLPKTAL